MRFVLALMLSAVTASADPLTPDQKKLVLSTLQSEVLALTVVRSVDPDVTPAKPTSDDIGKTFASMLAELQAVIKKEQCSVSSGFIGGCSWYYSAQTTSSTPGSTPVTSTSTTNYSVADSVGIVLNDIVGVNNTLVSTDSVADGTDFSGTIQIESQTMGTITANVQGTGSFSTDLEGKLYVEQDLIFPGFKAVFAVNEITAPGASVTSYLLNGETLSAAEIAFIALPQLQPKPKSGNRRAVIPGLPLH